ncbi:MAG TPA: glycosyltransferase family 1 protein, partial [Phaeodactylibacter sp.]|nr:glycosyltransferase family 1 protein [Phaeodactylibacter sp.]
AISQHTKNDIIKYYGISASKVSVIYQSCAETFKTKVSSSGIQRVLQSHHLPSEYMLYVGSIIERKNLLLLVEALAMLPRNIKIPLVVIGQGKGSYYKKVKSFIHKYGLASRVFFPKGITNEELPAIYQGAQLFCYVSAYEGFGIPILEALYSKVPVLTSKSSALPEAAGEGAFYVEDISAQAIASQMEVALIDEQRRRVAIEKGNAHTAVFDAEKLTAEMMGLYEGIV